VNVGKIAVADDGIVIRTLFALQWLPGRIGRSFGRKLRRRKISQALQRFETLLRDLNAGDVCVDLGANVGLVTERFAATGALVHAVEPDPMNFAELQKRVGHFPNVTLHNCAVGELSGRISMFRPIAVSASPGDMPSQGVTGQFRPGRSDLSNSFEVEQVSFESFIKGLGSNVRVIKMDIEGAELDILTALSEGRFSLECDEMFVETHERQYPETWPAVRGLRAAFRNTARPNVWLYWV
jgi:FkbM family methyltransferase